MKGLKVFTWLIMVAFVGVLLIPTSTGAEEVILYPGYLAGQVNIGTQGYTARNLSVNAYGGGYSSSKNVLEASYSLTVQGVQVDQAPWDYTVNMTATASPEGQNTPYTNIDFSPRTVPAPRVGEMLTNGYVACATVRFRLKFTEDSDTYTNWNAYGYALKKVPAGQEETNSHSYTNLSASPPDEFNVSSWDMPVVPNEEVRIYVYVHVSGKREDSYYSEFYRFWMASPDYRYEDIASCETLVIELEIAHVAPPKPPEPPTYEYGTVQGQVDLTLTIDSEVYNDVFSRHLISSYGSRSIYTNPGAYVMENVRTGTYTYRAKTYFDDNGRSFHLDWPYTDGDLLNDRVTVEEGQTSVKDFINAVGILTGELTFEGTVSNEDLTYYSIYADGASNIYDPESESWVRQPTYGGYSFNEFSGSDSDSTYRFFLTPGPWLPYRVHARKTSYEPGYYVNFETAIYDYNHRYDGWTYDFGWPSYVTAGETTVEDRTYCTGGVAVRFLVAGGGLMSDPYVYGYGSRFNDEEQEMSVTVRGNSKAPLMDGPEVEVHGPPADYDLYVLRAKTEDGTLIGFPSLPITLECGVFKGYDLTGPEIAVVDPPPDLITKEGIVTVSGTAWDDSGIASIMVNGIEVDFTLTPDPDPDRPNEVIFSFDLAVENGPNTITTTVADTAGNESFDQRSICVDRWMPMVEIIRPSATNQGCGFSLTIELDGDVIHQEDGPANYTNEENIEFTTDIGPLAVGAHTITATVADAAGNIASDLVTITTCLEVIVEVKPESRKNRTKGTATIFVWLPEDLTATTSLAIDDNKEISSGTDRFPRQVKRAGDEGKLILKFDRTEALMADQYFEVKGKYCPNPNDPEECYTWRGSDTTKH
jgi:hypothetical protein